jgi:hypothetical protein
MAGRQLRPPRSHCARPARVWRIASSITACDTHHLHSPRPSPHPRRAHDRSVPQSVARSTRINRTPGVFLISSGTGLSTSAWISSPTCAKRLRQLGSAGASAADRPGSDVRRLDHLLCRLPALGCRTGSVRWIDFPLPGRRSRCDDHRSQRDARQPAVGRLQPMDDRRQHWTVVGQAGCQDQVDPDTTPCSLSPTAIRCRSRLSGSSANRATSTSRGLPTC